MPSRIAKKAKQVFFEGKNKYHANLNKMNKNVNIDLGWGKLLFAQTYKKKDQLVKELLDEDEKDRNLAFYVTEPQVLIHLSKGRLFVDPSVSLRLNLLNFKPPRRNKHFQVRLLTSSHIKEVNRIYKLCNVLKIDKINTLKYQRSPALTYFVAEKENKTLGIIVGIDHKILFNSPRNDASLWGLAVSPEARNMGVGSQLIKYIVEHYSTKGRAHIDLSVLYYNQQAIALYKKLGFKKIRQFCLKCKNKINEDLYF